MSVNHSTAFFLISSGRKHQEASSYDQVGRNRELMTTMRTYVPGEVLRPAVVAVGQAQRDDLVLDAGLLQAHQHLRHPRRHQPPVDLHGRLNSVRTSYPTAMYV